MHFTLMYSSSMINLNSKYIFVFILLFSCANFVDSIKCYSCASENLQQDFLTRQRRPPGNIIALPKLFDNNCDLDTWILRTKSEVECPGTCYKWQQTLNNSGVYSYMTVRACYEHMFGSSLSTSHDTECSEKSNSLTCLPESSIFEHECFCKNADHCNSAFSNLKPFKAVVVLVFYSFILAFIMFR